MTDNNQKSTSPKPSSSTVVTTSVEKKPDKPSPPATSPPKKEDEQVKALSSDVAKLNTSNNEKDDENDENLLELDPNQDITVKQADPNSPLYSIKSFEELGLSEELLKGVYAMGFSHPSRIQEIALPMIIADP
jgi:ATP-dependent RNA helicase DDX19/DBP5